MPSEATLSARRTLSRCGLAYALFFLLAYGGQLLLLPLISLLPEEVAKAPLTVWLSTLIPMHPAFCIVAMSVGAAFHIFRMALVLREESF